MITDSLVFPRDQEPGLWDQEPGLCAVQELARQPADSSAAQDASCIVAQQFGNDRSIRMISLLSGAKDAGRTRANVRGDEFRGVSS